MQVISESFTGTNSPGWTLTGVNVNPFLTATNGDSVNNGWLRLTTVGPNQAASAVYNETFFAANTEITVTFDFAIWSNGGSGNGRADGIGFFLYDGSVPFAVGASGGSLGYAQKTVAPVSDGLAGGYFGIGIDNWGNFSNPTEGRIGGPGFISNAVAVRGPGSGSTGYEYITGTTSLPTMLDFPTYRPTNVVDDRALQIYLNRDNILTVSLKAGTNDFQVLFTADLSGFTRPETLGFGFFGGTGGAYQYHDIRNVSLTNITAYEWDNDTANGLWGVSNNWVGSRVEPALCSLTNSVNTNTTGALPFAGADIIFNDVYITNNQTVSLGGQTLTNRAIEFDGRYSYTLTNGTLFMDALGYPGAVQIRALDRIADSQHTIAANLRLGTNLQVQADTSDFLTFSGVIDTGGYTLQNVGSGNTRITGRITNNGFVSQSGTGFLLLEGSNTYSGGTRLSGGTIGIGNNNALGTGTLIVQGNGGALSAYGAARTITNRITLNSDLTLTGTNTITLAGNITNSLTNQTIYLDNASTAAISGNISLSESTSARTLIMDTAENSSLTVSGQITDGTSTASNLRKDGEGTLILSGSNTFTGNFNISNGTVRLAASDRLSDSTRLLLRGGTLDLNGSSSERVRELSFDRGVINYGTAGTSNHFMFTSNSGTTGPLVIRNQSAGDRLAIQSANLSTLSAANRGLIYFSGEGSGAITSAPNQTITGYGNTWTFLSGPTNAWFVWDGGGGNNNINTAGNWNPDGAPSSSSTLRLSFEGTVRTNGPTVNQNNFNVNVIRFNTNAGTFNISDDGGGNRRFVLTGNLPSIIQMSTNAQRISSKLNFDSNVIIDTFAGTGDLSLSGVIIGSSGFYKYGEGRVIFDGTADNSYSGAVFIEEGTVNIRHARALGDTGKDVTVSPGATLEVQNNISIASYNMTIGGIGQNGNGAIRNVSGNNTNANALTLSRAARIQSDSGNFVQSGNVTGSGINLQAGGNGNITFSGAIQTGAGEFYKDGTGTVTFSGGSANTYTGLTTVAAGNLNLNKTAGVNAIAGDLLIGGQGSTSTVSLLADNQIADSSAVILRESGALNTSNRNETIRQIDATTGSRIDLGTGAGGTLTVSGSVNSLVGARISGTGNLTKSGIGRMTLTESNTYSGVTTVAQGKLRVENSHALGTTAGATIVSNQASLEISGTGLNIAENVTIIGQGTSVEGALRNLRGTNTWSGNITVGTGGARINNDQDLLIVAGTVTSANQNLNSGGYGNIRYTSNINLGTGQFINDGPGHTILSNMNVTAAQTRLEAGSLIIRNFVTNNGALTTLAGTSVCIDTEDVVGGNLFRVNGNFTNAGTIYLKHETGGATSGNINGFHGIDFNGSSFTNTGTIVWSFDAPPSGIYGTVDNPYYGGMRSTNNIFAPYQTGKFFNNGFVALGLTGDQFLTTYYDGTYYYLAVIPEPRTYGMLGFGAILTILGLRASRRKKNSNS